MRFWSLKTILSSFLQGSDFHSYIGVATVLMTCLFLMTPLSSKATVGTSAYPLCFHRALASYPILPAPGLRLTNLLRGYRRASAPVTPFLMPVFRDLRVMLSAEILREWSLGYDYSSQSLDLIIPDPLTRLSLVILDDGSDAHSLVLPIATCLRAQKEDRGAEKI